MWRNRPGGYGAVTKTLHWVTVVVLLAQFALGYLMDVDDSSGSGRGRGRSGESGRGRGRGGEDDGYAVLDDTVLTVHVALGVTLVVLAVTRLVWRRLDRLPDWADELSATQRRVAPWVERALLGALVLMPATGVVLVRGGDDDLVPLHVASHVVFFTALAGHLFLNLRPAVLRRML